MKIQRALLSVSDKTGLVDFARTLATSGVELLSTGGTAKALRDAGLEVRDISDLTGFPEMMDGRVKTLHPVVHGGLLAVRDDAGHMASADSHAIGMIDLGVVNLYPFQQTVAKGADRDEIIENIDIGGPSMVRSAAKNHAYVAIVTDPADYAVVATGETTLDERRRFAAKAYALTAQYDAAIASWFAFADQGERFPATLPLVFRRGDELRRRSRLCDGRRSDCLQGARACALQGRDDAGRARHRQFRQDRGGFRGRRDGAHLRFRLRARPRPGLSPGRRLPREILL